MKQLAEGVWQLRGRPENNINVYVVEDALVDAGTPWDKRRILAQVRDRAITTHVLTHAHFDHFGSSHAVCSELGIPMWAGSEDAEAVESGRMIGKLGNRLVRLPAAKGQAISKRLQEGDVVAGFEVLDTPGHSPGHISFWRERDRVLLCGDVIWGQNPFLARGPMMEPYRWASVDPALNRESARRLASLRPELVCFGHGEPLRDPDRFAAAVEAFGA